jgi:hypothetical protein
MSLPEKLKLLLNSADVDELSHSERLWPYPFDAHDVPDFAILNSWLDDSLEDEDLKFHIENSVNCIRAVQLLLEESEEEKQEPTEDTKASFEQVLKLMKSVPYADKKSEAEEIIKFDYAGSPRQFLLYSTKGKIPVLSDGNKRHIFDFDPSMVLIVNDGKESEAKEEETIFRGVPASFAEDYPVNQMDSDEILVSLQDGQEIVLHLYLNYPLSNEQLEEALGVVREADEEKVRVGISAVLQGIPLMPADGAGIGPSEEMAEIVALERERIAERTQTLAAFADFNLEKFMQRDSATEVSKVIEVGSEYFKSFQNLFTRVWEPSAMGASSDDEADKSFKIELSEVNLSMRVASDPDGLSCCLTLFNEEGERAEDLSAVDIFDETQKLLSTFDEGYAEIPTKYFNDSKMLTFDLEGQKIRISLPRV